MVPIAAESWWKFDEARLMVLGMQNTVEPQLRIRIKKYFVLEREPNL